MTDTVNEARTPTFSPSHSPIAPNRFHQTSHSNYPPRNHRINTRSQERNSPNFQIKVSPPPNTNINQHLNRNNLLNVPGSYPQQAHSQQSYHPQHQHPQQPHPQSMHHQRNIPVEVIPPPPKPQTQTRVETIPYNYQYTDYEEKKMLATMTVPVQRKMTNYYAIEHITEYVPQQIYDYKKVQVPEQVIYKYIEYVPIEEEIVHLPKGIDSIVHNGRRYSNNNYTGLDRQSSPEHMHDRNFVPEASRMEIHNARQYYNEGGYIKDEIRNVRQGRTNASSRRTSRTNYVTSDGYTPQFDPIHEKRIQQIIADSYHHDTRYDHRNSNFAGNRQYQNMGQNIEGGYGDGFNKGGSYSQGMDKQNVNAGLYDGLQNLLGSKGMESPSRKLNGI